MLAAVRHAHQFLPFPMLGLDTDNGSEFLNTILLSSCQHEQLAFTRSRWSKPIPSRKKSLGAEPRSEQFAALQVPERIGRSLIPSTLPEVLRLIGARLAARETDGSRGGLVVLPPMPSSHGSGMPLHPAFGPQYFVLQL